MAERAVFRGSVGPEIYDDEDQYPSPVPGNYGITNQAALATEGKVVYLSTRPQEGYSTEFFGRINDLADGDDIIVPDRFIGPGGELFLVYGSSGLGFAMYMHHQIKTATQGEDGVHLVQDPWGDFSDTDGNSGTVNLYTTPATGSQNLRLENNTGGGPLTIDFHVISHTWYG